MTKAITLCIVSAALGGCVSFNGQMVNAKGEAKNCSTSGGGIGLGMIVGAGVALASNQICESGLKSEGFLLVKDIGKSGIDLKSDEQNQAVVMDAVPPAAPCLKAGDLLAKINDSDTPDLKDAKKALFGKIGSVINVAYKRNEETGECKFALQSEK